MRLRHNQRMPSNKEDLLAIYESKAAQVLPPITRDLLDALDLGDDARTLDAVGHALARAFMEGTALGATEMAAQATENGIPTDLTWVGDPGGS
jgi:hypothetical protein